MPNFDPSVKPGLPPGLLGFCFESNQRETYIRHSAAPYVV